MCKTNSSCGDSGVNCACGSSSFETPKGPKGDTGLSAYEEWLALGNTGTEADFINSLQGAAGVDGAAGATGPAGATGAAGADATIVPLTWVDITLANGWAENPFTGNAPVGSSTPQYAIDQFGFIHFRGFLDGSLKTLDEFAVIPALSKTKDSFSQCVADSKDADNSYRSGLFRMTATGSLSLFIAGADLEGPWFLSSVNPIYVAD